MEKEENKVRMERSSKRWKEYEKENQKEKDYEWSCLMAPEKPNLNYTNLH